MSSLEVPPAQLPRHPGVCAIDLFGLAVSLLLISFFQPKPAVAALLVTMAAMYAVSCLYHWLPDNPARKNADYAMIAVLIAATYVPFWGTMLPTTEMAWRFPIVGFTTGAFILVRCSECRWSEPSVILYPALGIFGLTISFKELQTWLPPIGQALFWAGVGLYLLQFALWKAGRRNGQHLVLLCATTLHSVVVLSYL